MDASVPKQFTNSIGMRLNLIPAGTFLMGSPESEADRIADEHQHQVTISKGFYMGTTEVTQGQWKAVMGTEPWKDEEYTIEGSDVAASYVSYEDAVAFCKKLSRSRRTHIPIADGGRVGIRLSGGKRNGLQFWGNGASSLKDYGWYYENADGVGEEYAHGVGQKRANGYGLYDMHGNVWEWCSDWYDEDYYKDSPSVDPSGPSSGIFRLYRGGSWYNAAGLCRSANRSGFTPDLRNNSLGFRLVSVSQPVR
ncbi:MAG: formylglycine-generating enzyme family protein [Pirellulaceae bacterium]